MKRAVGFAFLGCAAGILCACARPPGPARCPCAAARAETPAPAATRAPATTSAAPCAAASASAAPATAQAPTSTPAIPYDMPSTRDFPPPPPALPSAKTHTPVASTLMIVIDRNGAFSVNGRRVAGPEALTRIARKAHASAPDTRAIIAADRGAPYGSVVGAMDRLKMAGITNFAFAVSVKPAP